MMEKARSACRMLFAAGVSSLVLAGAAIAGEARQIHLDIPPGELGKALLQVSRETGHELIFNAAMVRGKRTAGLKGNFTAQQAFDQLLARTGHTARLGNRGAYLIVALDRPATEPRAAVQASDAPEPPPAPIGAPASEDIIVTAQRRSQRLVDVPISVSTASAADIERAGGASIENLTKVTPGVYLQRNVTGLSPTVRGIGSTGTATGGEQNVAVYVDNIYYPTPTGNIFDLASVSGVEVLKGPQGTLFGRNATGGAILIHTRDPGFTSEGAFNLSYERFDQIRTSAYLNMPVSDKIALNATVAYRYSKGYIRDLLTDRIVNQGHNFTIRGKLLVQPSDNLSIIFTAAHADFDDPSGNVIRNLQPAPLIAVAGVGPIANDRFTASVAASKLFIRTATEEYSARAKWETGAGVLSSYTAYLDNKLNTLLGISGTYLRQDVFAATRTKSFSQEVNFASQPGEPLTYVVGVYYFRSRARVPALTVNDVPLSNSANQNDALAGYVDGSYKFGALSVIAGVRYSHERRKGQSAFAVSAPSPYTRFQTATDKQWTPRFGLQYAISERSNLYATYSRGFKSGVFDLSSPDGPGVDPEKVNAYEVGFKTASHDFTFNLAGYYYDYKGTQVTANVSGEGGQGSIRNVLFNVPKSRIYGVEADGTFRLSDNFDIRAAAAYTHARYIDFKTAPGLSLDPENPDSQGGLVWASVQVDASGKTMVRSPTFTASGTLHYHSWLSDKNEIDVAVSPYYSSRVYYTFFNDQSQKAYMTIDANATLTLDKNMKLSIFGQNLTDKIYATNIGQNALGLKEVVFAMPRTYGVSFGYSF